MKLREYEKRLNGLKIEREHFLQLLRTLDKKLEIGEITRYNQQFTIKSITRGLSEREYLQKVDGEIASTEEIIQRERQNNYALLNIIKISGILAIVIVTLLMLTMPELEQGNNNIKSYVIDVNTTYEGTQIYNIMPRENTIIKSLKINGAYSGNVKVYLVSNSSKTAERYLVFDSQKPLENLSQITGKFIISPKDAEQNSTTSKLKSLIQDVCDETCKISISSNNAYLLIIADDNSSIRINSIEYTQPIINHPPKQPKRIEDIKTNKTTIELNLSTYFIDQDDDVLHYQSSNIPGAKANTTREILTVEVAADGMYSGFVYVTDGQNTINSNIFTITVNTSQKIAPSGANNSAANNNNNNTALPLTPTGNVLNETSPLTNQTAGNKL